MCMCVRVCGCVDNFYFESILVGTCCHYEDAVDSHLNFTGLSVGQDLVLELKLELCVG